MFYILGILMALWPRTLASEEQAENRNEMAVRALTLQPRYISVTAG
jgi:hypothetical protein